MENKKNTIEALIEQGKTNGKLTWILTLIRSILFMTPVKA